MQLRWTIVVLCLFCLSCSHNNFLKRRYTEGVFRTGFSEKRKPLTQSFALKTEIKNLDSNDELHFISQNNHNFSQPLFACYSISKKPVILSKTSFVHDTERNKKLASKTATMHIKDGKNDSYHKEVRHRNDFIQWCLASLFASSLGIAIIFLSRKEKLKQVSKWANKNITKTKFVIAGAAIVNSISSLILGEFLYLNQVPIPDYLSEFSIGAFGVTMLLYPKKQNIIFDKTLYLKKKIADFSLAVFSSIMIISGSYHQEPNLNFKTLIMPNVIGFNQINKNSESQLKTQPKESFMTHGSLKEEKQDKNMKWWQGIIIAFIILTSIVTMAAITLFSCALACSGNEGLAYLFLVVGNALAISLCVYGIIKISKIKIAPKLRNK